MTYNKIVNGYYMNVVDDNVIKYEISYNEVSPEIKHYTVTFEESVTTSPTTYADSEGIEYNWDNESVTLSEVDTEM